MPLTLRVLACLLLVTPEGWAQPAQILLIRHAEKPPIGADLSARGRIRAAALVPYFLETPELLKFGKPVAIYAQQPKHLNRIDGEHESSRRPVQTVTPLANTLHLPITGTTRDKYASLVKQILTDPRLQGKTVVICWEHDALAGIAQAFLSGKEVTGAPPKWKWPGGDCYDRTWVITFVGARGATFQDFPQRLLYGDTSE